MNDNFKNIFPKDSSDDHDFLKKLDEKLYSRDRSSFTDMRTKLVKKDMRDFSWQKTDKNKSQRSLQTINTAPVKKSFSLFTLGLLVVSIIVFLGSLSYAFFSLSRGGFVVSQEKIGIETDFPGFVNAGENINSEIKIVNSNRVEFTEAILSIDLVSEIDGAKQNISQIDIGNVSSGQNLSKNFSFILNGKENEMKNIEVSLFYKVADSDTSFQKKIQRQIKITKSPVILNVTGPKFISIGQISDYRVSVRGGSGLVPSVAIKLDLPKEMKILESSISPTNKDYFNLGDIKSGEEKILTFKAEYRETKELIDNFNLKIKVGTSGDGDIKDILGEESLQLSLSAVPFKIIASLENQIGITQYFTGKNPKVKITVLNDSSSTIKNGILNIKLAGGLLNPKTVTVGSAQYDAGTASIRATSETNKKLKEILPGEKIEFEINYQDLRQTNLSATRRLTLESSFSADIPDTINSPATGRSVLNLLPKDNTNVALKTLYFSGAFKNIGPMPPRIGQKTTYTIVASVDTLGGFDKGVMTMTLPEYVEYIESSEVGVTYKKDKREVIWSIGSMKKSDSEVLSVNKKEMSFRVSITPSPDQFRLSPNLTRGSRFEAAGIDKNVISIEVPDVTINFSQDAKYEYSKGYADVAE